MIKKWTKTGEKQAYKGWRNIIQKTFLDPDGKEWVFDVVENAPYVTIAAFTEKKEAILVRQFRPGPETILTSFPEGYIDANEEPKQAALRELLEETGYHSDHIRLIKVFRSAYNSQTQICLLATNCRLVAPQTLDESEDIEVFTMPLPDFRTYLRNADARDFTNVDVGYLGLDLMGWL